MIIPNIFIAMECQFGHQEIQKGSLWISETGQARFKFLPEDGYCQLCAQLGRPKTLAFVCAEEPVFEVVPEGVLSLLQVA